MAWSADEAPTQAGRVAVVTGGNSGIGLETARVLAQRGAQVVLACRSAERGEAARDALLAENPEARVQAAVLDLADLASVRTFAARMRDEHESLHTLVNNAGVMALPERRTVDGFELHIGTNHLGPFALTLLVLPLLVRGAPSRIVTVSSLAHRMGAIRVDDLHWRDGYRKWAAYGQSKLANLLFTRELSRRLALQHPDVMAVSCHPGYAATPLHTAGPRMEGSAMRETLSRWANALLAQSAADGALPTLYAATSLDVEAGDYIGPSSIGEIWGSPRKTEPHPAACDDDMARRLWALSEAETGVCWASFEKPPDE